MRIRHSPDEREASTNWPTWRRHGFTLIELLVVIAIIAVSPCRLLGPQQGKPKSGVQCMNNHRQLARVAVYAEDNRDILVFATADPTYAAYSWVQGVLDFNPAALTGTPPTISKKSACGRIAETRSESGAACRPEHRHPPFGNSPGAKRTPGASVSARHLGWWVEARQRGSVTDLDTGW
jgi:prepilin-type N-terminal cleavage/methylation domain-containing protein